jgi:hypothetical protein
MGEKEGINILPVVGSGGGGTDIASAMALQSTNPWMYLVMMTLFANGGFGFGGNRGGVSPGAAALDIETQNKLSSLQAQINDNNNNQWAREAIQGNTFAISQLSQNLGVNYNALTAAIGTVKDSIFQLGAQNGMGFAGVTNAINLGNLNLIQQLKDCCCGLKTQILEQGYQGRIETINQTNELKDSQRIENGLTRAELASFRQAWENSRYQDVVAEKTRLQTELDLLRTQQGDQARFGVLEGQFKHLEWEMQQFINTYGTGKSVAPTGTNG